MVSSPGIRSRILRLFAPVSLVLAALMLTLLQSAPAHAAPAGAAWQSFVDPVYGFTLRYPSTWGLSRGYDGSHITLEDTVTYTTVSPIVTLDSRTPAQILAAPLPPDATHIQSRRVAGVPALDFTVPYAAGIQPASQNAARVQAAYRTVVVPVPNSAGTTNVYTFLVTLPTNSAGEMNSAVNADNATFEQMLGTFTLPATVRPAAGAQARQGGGQGYVIIGGGGGCGSACWADNNWAYNRYDDASPLYCDGNGYTGTWGTFACADGNNMYGVTPPGSPPYQGYFQPYFECAEFVARSLGQDGDIPGLHNGGVNGITPVTSTIGSYSYDRFPFTYVGASYSGDTIYALDNVNGLYNYLINSGLGYSIGTNMGSASLGDVVFFYSGSSLEHTMIVTGIISGGSGVTDLELDGHNVDNYHISLNYVKGGFSSYVIIHRRINTGAFGQPTLSGSWNSTTDGYGQAIHWVYTSCSTCDTAGATYSISDQGRCAVAVYVPAGNATANINFGVKQANGSWALRAVNENAIDGWALLYKWGSLSSDPVLINVSNNSGTSGQQLGIGQEAFMC